MHRRITALSLALALVLASSSPASGVGGRPWAPSTFFWSSHASTHRTTSDSITIYAYSKWNTAARNALRNLSVNEGLRYTQEMNDTSLNLNSFGLQTSIVWGTTMPNPVHDLDDDNGDRRWEEAEVTVDNTSFPTVNQLYYYFQEFSRWYCVAQQGSCLTWLWDNSSGSVKHLSQMSFWLGEWQADDWTSIYDSTPYSSMSQPSSSALGVEANPNTSPSDSGVSDADDLDGLSVIVEREGSEADLRVSPPQVGELPQYLEANAARASDLVAAGELIDAIVTFKTPLTAERYAALDAIEGVELRTVEAIGSLPSGLTLTVGGGALDARGSIARLADEGATPLGIVAAEVTVSPSAYASLASQSAVLIVDVGPTVAMQAARGGAFSEVAPSVNFDVVMNDLYWLHAGLTR